jgi:hypothetical protein
MWTRVPELPASKTATTLYSLVRERGTAASESEANAAASESSNIEIMECNT